MASTATILVLWKALVFLFTRQIGDPLEHPVRRDLYNRILAQPAVSYRQLMRETGLANGVLQHHLGVLRRQQLIVDQHQRNKRLFFENHGKYTDSWKIVAILRGPEAQLLIDWISTRKSATQAEAILWGKQRGWRRTFVQTCLKRLTEAEVIHATRQGRTVSYAVR